MAQKADRPITQHVMPECDCRSLDVFSQAIEAQEFGDYRGIKIIDLKRNAARVRDKLRAHRPQDFQSSQSATVFAASTAIAPPQASQVHFCSDRRCGSPLARAKFD